ncbi:MAG TPA: DUF3667 domain-containing protein [Saprospiraceae bacterium]|nr:DUF3667 domain-containing protein [Saprospiraceae bacterium]
MARNKIKQQVCANCGHYFGQDENFCPKCGQENHSPNQPIKHYIVELIEAFLHLDSKFFHTIWVILRYPGLITKEYNENKRARYMPPIRLYVFVSLVFFISLQAPHVYDAKNKKEQEKLELEEYFEKPKRELQLYRDSLNKGMQEFQTDSLKEANLNGVNGDSLKTIGLIQRSLMDSVQRRMDSLENKLLELRAHPIRMDSLFKNFQNMEDSANIHVGSIKLDLSRNEFNRLISGTDEVIDSFIISENQKPNFINRTFTKQILKLANGGDDYLHRISEKIIKFASGSFFFLMPIFGFLLYLLYIRRKRNYYEYLIFSLHLHIVVFLVLGIIFLINIFIELDPRYFLLGTLLLYFYLFKSLRLNFNQSRKRTFVKSILLTFSYFIFLIIALAITIILGFLTV